MKVQVRPLPNPAPLIKRQRNSRACAVPASVKDSLPSLLCFLSLTFLFGEDMFKKGPAVGITGSAVGPRLAGDRVCCG